MLEILFGSRLRAKVLGWLYSHPDERFFVRQLTTLVGEDSTNASRELARLATIGILVSTTEGKQKYYQANRKSPVFKELNSMACKTGLISATKTMVTTPKSQGSLLYQRFGISKQKLSSFSRRHHIARLSLYGSVLRPDFRPDSDIDVLVEFKPGHAPGFGIVTMEKELSDLLGRKVDLRTPGDLSRYFREQVIREASVQYVAK